MRTRNELPTPRDPEPEPKPKSPLVSPILSLLEETFPDEVLVRFLRKPYKPEQLLEAIHAAGRAANT